MKKTIAIIFFAAISIKQYAQIEKGTYVPGVSIGITYGSTPQKDSLSSIKSSTFSVTTNLSFGKFIKDNLLLTGVFSYVHSNSKTDYTFNKYPSENEGSSSFGNTESIAASLLKYKFFTENFAIRYGSSFSASYTEQISRNYSYDQTRNSTGIYTNTLSKETTYYNILGVSLNLVLGIQYFVSKNLALTGSMGFFSANYSYSPYQKTKHGDLELLSFSLTPAFNAFNAGLSYYIRPKAAK